MVSEVTTPPVIFACAVAVTPAVGGAIVTPGADAYPVPPESTAIELIAPVPPFAPALQTHAPAPRQVDSCPAVPQVVDTGPHPFAPFAPAVKLHPVVPRLVPATPDAPSGSVLVHAAAFELPQERFHTHWAVVPPE